MEDGSPSPSTLFGSLSESILDFDYMDELFHDGYWLETTEERSFPTLGVSDSDQFNLNLQNYREGMETEGINENSFSDLPQTDNLVRNETSNREVILAKSFSGQSEYPRIFEGTETNKRLWDAPNANPSPYSSLESRLMLAIEHLRESTKNNNVLIQIWVPIKREGKKILVTKDQPFLFNPNSESLTSYRDFSKQYHFAAEENSKDLTGLPGRVFLKRLPEWTPDVRLFKVEEYPRVNYAQQCNVSGSLALPVFEPESGTCLGVVEIVSTTPIISYRPELENICKALQAVDLRSSDISSPPIVKECDNSYETALAEIQEVLKSVCDAYGLPLAQTWAPCDRRGKCGSSHTKGTRFPCISTVDSACYIRDKQVLGFHEACSEHRLFAGEGIVGGAFATNQPCFCPNIADLSKTEYPLSHYAKMFGLHACVAVRLRSMYTGSADFVLEFFLPSECKDTEEQWRLLMSLSSGIQHVSRSLRVLTDDELERESVDPPNVGNPEPEPESQAQRKGKAVDIPSADQKEEVEEDLEGMAYWEDKQICQDFGSKGSGRSGGGIFSVSGSKTGDKRRAKSEKNIPLEVLRQHFAGSLKDAAKRIGVCPTTLKRICRQHGIARWPSRKIKKVGHSLQKLQLMIESVQGIDGPIQLGSFYKNFPELSSAKTHANTSSRLQSVDQSKPSSLQLDPSLLVSPATTNSKSPTSSCSQSSSSSSSTEVKPPPVPTSLAEKSDGGLQRTLSDIELCELGREETKLLVRSQSQKIYSELPSEVPKLSNQISKEASGGFRVKATFGEEKVRFTLLQNWGFEDVKKEIVRRFHLDKNGKIDLKYLDDDLEWVLLTCDSDLEECIDIHKSTRSRTIKISVHHGFNPNPRSSFGSRGLG